MSEVLLKDKGCGTSFLGSARQPCFVRTLPFFSIPYSFAVFLNTWEGSWMSGYLEKGVQTPKARCRFTRSSR